MRVYTYIAYREGRGKVVLQRRESDRNRERDIARYSTHTHTRAAPWPVDVACFSFGEARQRLVLHAVPVARQKILVQPPERQARQQAYLVQRQFRARRAIH